MKTFLIAFLILVLGTPQNAQAKSAHPEYEKNIREGFAATAGFEIVAVDRVPFRSKDKTEYRDTVTYRLHPHPDPYKLNEEGLSHILWVTLGWKESKEQSPFVFDLYLHGDRKSENSLAIRVSGLDIRKFLHQSIASFSDNPNLTRLQAYFEEFSRKGKILYPLTDSSPSPPNLPLKGRDPAHESRLLNVASRITDLKITNNCREPGNYEVEIRDGLSRSLLKSSFSFPTKDYDAILTRFHGLGIRDQGTGMRVPNNVRNQEPFRYWDSFLPWKWMKSFPNVDIEALSVIGTSVDHPHPNPLPEGEGIKGANPFSGGEGIKRGEIDVVKGRIPFEEYKYDPEVVGKSGYHALGPEPLSYVRVDSQLPTPNGFESLDGSSPVAYWASKANAGKVVPYAFRTFEEIQRYDVYLSGFDLSGVYIGRSDLYLFDKEQKSGRWHFNFQYLRDLKRFEFRQWDNEIVEIRIVGAQHVAPGKKAVNFIFGNLSIAVGESVEFLLGLGTQPLITAYNQNPYKDTLIYGFAYGADGIILDHHDLGIGVEKVSIKRVDLQTYKVRLISYERILPVWEGIIHAGTLHSK